MHRGSWSRSSICTATIRYNVISPQLHIYARRRVFCSRLCLGTRGTCHAEFHFRPKEIKYRNARTEHQSTANEKMAKERRIPRTKTQKMRIQIASVREIWLKGRLYSRGAAHIQSVSQSINCVAIHFSFGQNGTVICSNIVSAPRRCPSSCSARFVCVCHDLTYSRTNDKFHLSDVQ